MQPVFQVAVVVSYLVQGELVAQLVAHTLSQAEGVAQAEVVGVMLERLVHRVELEVQQMRQAAMRGDLNRQVVLLEVPVTALVAVVAGGHLGEEVFGVMYLLIILGMLVVELEAKLSH